MMRKTILLLLILSFVIAVPTCADVPKERPKGVIAWLAEKLGIDPRAYANLTGVRGEDERLHGPRLVELDIKTNTERTLWSCGGCWSPAMIGDDVAVLRDEANGGPAIWIVPADGETPRLAFAVPNVVAILGRTSKPSTLAIAISDASCGLRFAEADLIAKTVRIPEDSSCLSPPLPSRDRLLANRLVGMTAARDRSGKRVPRRLIVTEPADAEKPVATRLGSFTDDADRFDPIWRDATHVVYVCSAEATTESRISAVSLFLHAWMPELGAPPKPLTQFEQALVHAAETARAGRFRSASAELAALESSATTARDRSLWIVFRSQIENTRFQLIGGGMTPMPIQLPVDLHAQSNAEMQALIDLQEDGGVTLLNHELAVRLAQHDIPASRRMHTIGLASATYGNLVMRQAPRVEMLRPLYEQMGQRVVEEGLLSRADADLFGLLIDARWVRAGGDSASAIAAFQKALAAAPPSATPEILIEIGDTYAAPAGSPSLLGTDPVSGSMLRTLIGSGVRPPALTSPSPANIAAAEDAYARAAAAGNAGVERRVAIRRSYLRYCEGDESRAISELERLTTGNDITAWSAAACAGVLRIRRDDLRAALRAALAEDAIGVTTSVVEMAQTVAIAQSALAANRTAAIALLEHVSDLAEESSIPRMAVEPLTDLSHLYDMSGRRDAAVVAKRRAIQLLKQHIAIEEPFDPANLLSERTTLEGLEVQQHITTGARRMEEQTGGWGREVITHQQEMDKTDLAISLANSASAETARAARLKVAMDAVRASGDCAARLPRLREIREQAIAARDPEWAVLLFDMTNADCERSWLNEDRKKYEERDIAAPIAARIANAERPEPETDVFEVMKATFVLDMLEVSEAWQPLARDANALITLIDTTPHLASFAVPIRRYAARASFELGQPAEARRIVEGVVADSLWKSRPAADRLAMLGVALEAEGALCDPPSSQCDTAHALYALELLLHAQHEAQIDRSGVDAGWRQSAERAAIEARLARADSMAPADLARLRHLHEDRSADELRRESPPTRTDIDAALASMPRNLTLLAYYIGRRHVLIWRARGGDVHLVRVDNPDTRVEQLAASIGDELASAIDDRWRDARRELHEMLIESAGGIPEGDDVFIIAAGVLASFPFEVLANESGRELGLHHAVVYGSRISSGKDAAEPSATNRAALAIGINSSSLVTAEDEATMVVRILGGTALTGTDATAAAVHDRLPAARWVHIATHATLAAENPFQSYFTLAGGERLEAWSLFRDAPAARLITLSACEAAAAPRALAGRAAAVSESTSLVSFAFAGNAQFVFASLWRVDDRTSLRLMEAFYEALGNGSSEAAALRNAKNMIAENGSVHPYYYANFILTARSLATFIGMTPSKKEES